MSKSRKTHLVDFIVSKGLRLEKLSGMESKQKVGDEKRVVVEDGFRQGRLSTVLEMDFKKHNLRWKLWISRHLVVVCSGQQVGENRSANTRTCDKSLNFVCM